MKKCPVPKIKDIYLHQIDPFSRYIQKGELDIMRNVTSFGLLHFQLPSPGKISFSYTYHSSV